MQLCCVRAKRLRKKHEWQSVRCVCAAVRVPWQHKGVLVWDAFLVRVYVSHWSVPLASAAEFVDTPKNRDLRIRRVCRRIYACKRGVQSRRDVVAALQDDPVEQLLQDCA